MSEVEEVRRQVAAEWNWRAENASSTARRLALGVVAVMWGLLTMHTVEPAITSRWQHAALIMAGMLAVSSLFFDWLQAVVGYYTVGRDFDRVHAPDFDSKNQYGYEISKGYQITHYSFVAKQVLSPLSFLVLVAAVVPIIIKGVWQVPYH